MPRRFSDTLVAVIAGIIRGWRGLRRGVKISILAGAGIAVAAIAAVVVLTSLGSAPKAAVAEATPQPTMTPAPTPTPEPVPTTAPETSVDLTLQYGDQNADVTVLQNRLMDLGYLDIDEATDYFGPATKYAIQLFQRQCGLPQDGVAGGETQLKLFSDDAPSYTILTGTTGEDVRNLQKQLIDLGYLGAGKATGYYGDETTKAVKDFQKANDLSVDGKTGEQTLDCIYSPNAIATPEKRAEIREAQNVDEMIAAAQSKIGKPYVSGAEGPNSFDCSGLVYYCLKAAGSNRGRYNAAGYAAVSTWKKVSWSELKKGDLMFFWSDKKGKIGHVAIYIGGGMIIDASSSNGKVVKRSCTGSWFRTNFKWARRPWGN
jgi:cell wall-associated NlpC family hydrolase